MLVVVLLLCFWIADVFYHTHIQYIVIFLFLLFSNLLFCFGVCCCFFFFDAVFSDLLIPFHICSGVFAAMFIALLCFLLFIFFQLCCCFSGLLTCYYIYCGIFGFAVVLKLCFLIC